jgi:Polyketide cyclase / dehydrase and lipid transport
VRAGPRGSSALARWRRALQFAAAFALAPAAAAQSAVTGVEVRQTQDGYAVDLVMCLAVPRELAFEVLVDFEHMASWVPNVRESRVLEREANRATIEYEGVVRYGILAIPFTTVRRIEFAAPAWIRATQISGSMKRHESRIELAVRGAQTCLDYHVEMVPGTLAAMVLNSRRVELELREHFDAIAAEMLRRNAAPPPASR